MRLSLGQRPREAKAFARLKGVFGTLVTTADRTDSPDRIHQRPDRQTSHRIETNNGAVDENGASLRGVPNTPAATRFLTCPGMAWNGPTLRMGSRRFRLAPVGGGAISTAGLGSP